MKEWKVVVLGEPRPDYVAKALRRMIASGAAQEKQKTGDVTSTRPVQLRAG